MQQILEDLVVLTGFTEQDSQILRESAPQTKLWVEDIIKEFYDTLFAHSRTASVFTDSERPHREETLRQWYLEVTSGQISPDFWERQWFVGLVHIKRKVNNQFVVGILSRVQDLFLTKCMLEYDKARGERVFEAFKRVTDVIAGLIVEGYRLQYLSAVERVSGIEPALIERMAISEADRMVSEARSK